MTFDGPRYASLAELYPEGTVVVNSISKTAKATGWRIGWVVASAARTRAAAFFTRSGVRGTHGAGAHFQNPRRPRPAGRMLPDAAAARRRGPTSESRRPALRPHRPRAQSPRGHSTDGSRRRRGCRVDIPWRRARTYYRRVAATPRLPRGYSVETSNAADGTRQFGRDRPRLRYLRKRDMLAASLQKAGFWIGPLPKGSYYLFVGFASVPALRGLGPTEAAILCGNQHLEGNAKVRVPRRRRCG